MRAWGPSTGPTACALAGRRCALWGWRMGVPGGGAFRRCEGRLRSGPCPLPTARPPVGLSAPSPRCCWRGCAAVGTQDCPLGLHALYGLLAAGVVGGRPRGGWPATVVRGVWCQALSSGASCRGFPQPVCPGCGWCGRGDPALAPQRAPMRAGVARCGGAFRRCEGRLRSGAPPSLTACPLRGLSGSATHVLWARVGRCGGQHCPFGLHALWGLRAAAVVGGHPRGRWPATAVRGVWCQALSPFRPPVLWSTFRAKSIL